jgi:hypothetical protein
MTFLRIVILHLAYRWFNSSLGVRARSAIRDPQGWSIPSPSERNATAKQGYERRPPIAYSLLPSARIQAHAFASCSIRTQRTSLRHRRSKHCTASHILSVVYATEKYRGNTGLTPCSRRSTSEPRHETLLQRALGEHATHACPVESALAHGAWGRGGIDIALRKVAGAKPARRVAHRQ